MTSTTFVPVMVPATLGVRGRMHDGTQLMSVYTIELDGELGRSVAPVEQVDRLKRLGPDRWLSDGTSTLVALRDGLRLGTVELRPLFTAAR